MKCEYCNNEAVRSISKSKISSSRKKKIKVCLKHYHIDVRENREFRKTMRKLLRSLK